MTQLQKYFPHGRPKRGGRTVFTNFLLLHEKRVEDMILDIKDKMQVKNLRISKQRVQHYNITKLGYLMCHVKKVEPSRWSESF